MSETKATIAYRYKGPGAHYGVPAEDLTQEAYDALSPRLKRAVLFSGDYVAVKPAKPSATAPATADTGKES